jgi:5-methylthioadenosine/S-adenosylhomocysteine deaminase
MILIQGGTILKITSRYIEKGYILIEKDRIKEIGEGEYKKEDYKIKIDASNSIIMPGLINTHTHISMTFLRGVADDLPLEKWLKEYIWPIESKFLSKEFVYYSSCLGIAEMLLGGITSFCDMYFFCEEIAKACEDIGIRGFITPGILDFETPYFKNSEEAIQIAENFIKNYKKHDLIHPGIAPHSVYTCSLNTLKKCKGISEKYDVIIHMHLSETKNEYEESVKKFGLSPVKYLEKNGILCEKFLGAHCVWFDDEDIEIFKQRNCSISHNPESNLKLGSGIAPIKKFLDKKINVSIGTDGAASNNNLDLFEAMRITALIHKGINLNPELLPAEEILKMATIYASKCLNFEEIGEIEQGKKADIIIIDISDLPTTPFYNPYSALVYSLNSNQVKHVIVNGKIVVENREIKNLDLEKIKRIANEFKEKIRNAV